jgi:hypothetical protein
VSGWSPGCAVQPLQRPVPVASALQTSDTLYVNATHASQAGIPTYTHTHLHDFGPRVAHCPEPTHVCIVRAPVPPPPTRVPAPPHTLISPTCPLSCLVYSASAVSSLKCQAWGIRKALCALFPHPATNASLSPDASMQTQAAGHRDFLPIVLGMSHYGPQCAHTDDTAAPSSSGHSISTRH